MALSTVPNKNPQAPLEHSCRIENRWCIERWELVEHYLSNVFVVIGFFGNHLAGNRFPWLRNQAKDFGVGSCFLPYIFDPGRISTEHLVKG